MNSIVYYKIKSVPLGYDGKNTLPYNILKHIKETRKSNVNDSRYAWQLLQDCSLFNLEEVEFLKTGKPTHKSYSISLSHSKGYVAIAFCSNLTELGIDIEKIQDRDLSFLSKISSKFKGGDNSTLYNLWTEHEATVKALNLKVFKDNDADFYGITKTIENLDGKFSLSIYNKVKIEEYENKV